MPGLTLRCGIKHAGARVRHRSTTTGKGCGMDRIFRSAPAIGRRAFLQSTSAGVAMAAAGGAPAWAQGTPWATAPKSKVDKVNFVVWTYGDIYTKIAEKFKEDWGVPVDSTISSFNDHPTKLMTMFAGGETIDVSQSSPFSFPNFVAQGLVEPLNDLPGADDYVADFTDIDEEVAVHGRQADGPAVLLHCLGVELLHRPDGEGRVRAVQDLRRAAGAVRARRRRTRSPNTRSSGSPVSGWSSFPAPGPDDLEPRRRLLRQGRQPSARRRARSRAKR